MTEDPFFSVVIPSYSRARQLDTCLRAIQESDYPSNRYEIIVVDDGGPEPLHLPAASPERAPVVTIHRQENLGPAAARNTGVRLARGHLVAFTDDDCCPDPGWLRALADAFRRSPGALVGGSTVNTLTRNAYSIASQSLIAFLYAYYNRSALDARFFTSNNFAMPVDRFWELGGFDVDFRRAGGEDRDLCDRWSERGWPVVYAADAVVRHAHALTMKEFLQQHFRYGQGAYHFHRLRAQRSKRMWVEPWSFYLGLIGRPFSERVTWRTLPVTGLMLITQVANAAGFFWEKLTGRAAIHPGGIDPSRDANKPGGPEKGP